MTGARPARETGRAAVDALVADAAGVPDGAGPGVGLAVTRKREDTRAAGDTGRGSADEQRHALRRPAPVALIGVVGIGTAGRVGAAARPGARLAEEPIARTRFDAASIFARLVDGAEPPTRAAVQGIGLKVGALARAAFGRIRRTGVVTLTAVPLGRLEVHTGRHAGTRTGHHGIGAAGERVTAAEVREARLAAARAAAVPAAATGHAGAAGRLLDAEFPPRRLAGVARRLTCAAIGPFRPRRPLGAAARGAVAGSLVARIRRRSAPARRLVAIAPTLLGALLDAPLRLLAVPLRRCRRTLAHVPTSWRGRPRRRHRGERRDQSEDRPPRVGARAVVTQTARVRHGRRV